MDTGHWIFDTDVGVSEDMYGFIYEITNTVTGKKYIGKKQCFMRIKRKPLKGYKRNRITQTESTWKTYTGSCKELNNDMQLYGKDKFIFKIIKKCDSKWALAYYEIKEQLDKNVLLRDDYYNGIINVRIGRPPLKELELIESSKL